VATIEIPASHHGTERPEAKNSVVFCPTASKKRAGGEADGEGDGDDDPVQEL
jgi:hypothetical protein